MVHYMPWFVTKPYSGSWGWHWTMNHFNPDTLNASGERNIASWYYPLIGPYDSDDPVVLEYHVLLMKLGGVDGVIVDWYGMDNYLDYGVNEQRTAALYPWIAKAGLKFSLCYEDATIQQEVTGGFITASGAVTHAQQTMLFAETNFFAGAAFLRWSNQPVLLNFGPQYFKANSQWQSIFSVLDATNQPAFFTEDSRLPVGAGAFDWPPMYLSQTNNGTLTTTALESYLSGFQASAAGWPGFISSAFPRFHDIYAQAGVSASYGYLDDQSGNTLRETLGQAMINGSALVQVVTWNDFGEGTIVEPTVDFGFRDLGIIQDYRRQFLDSTFPYHTNDLTLPLRLYNMRRSYSGSLLAGAEMDRIFTNIVSGNLTTASLQLSGLEAGRPVLYNISGSGNQVQFTVGGYVSAAGMQLQTCSSNLTPGTWQTGSTIPTSTNTIVITAPVPDGASAIFFRIQNAGP